MLAVSCLIRNLRFFALGFSSINAALKKIQRSSFFERGLLKGNRKVASGREFLSSILCSIDGFTAGSICAPIGGSFVLLGDLFLSVSFARGGGYSLN